MKKPSKRQTPAQRREAARAAAMPEVKRLVRKVGRSAIANCLSKLRDHEKGVERLNALKRELAQLEKRL